MYSSTQIVQAALVSALVLLPPPAPGIQRDPSQAIDLLQRAECEYRGIAASYDEVTRAYILQAYTGGRLIRWQARPSPYNPETETLVTAVFTATAPRSTWPSAGITWRYSTLSATRISAHGRHAQAALAIFRQTVDGFVDRMVYAPAAGALHAEPSTAAPPVAEFAAGAVLLVEGTRDDWLRVRLPPSSQTGWLPREQTGPIGN